MAHKKFTKYVVLWREHNTVAGYSCTEVIVIVKMSVVYLATLNAIFFQQYALRMVNFFTYVTVRAKTSLVHSSGFI